MTEISGRTLELSVPSEHDGVRLDRFIAQSLPDLSRAFIQKLIKEGHVLIVGAKPRPSLIVRRGMRVRVHVPPPQDAAPKPQPLPLDIVFEDDDLLVINKAAGMVVHPGAGTPDHTLVNAVLHHCPQLSGIGGVRRPGIVHRLDKNTTGLLIVAKNDFTHRALAAQLKARKISRTYWALVFGSLPRAQGIIDAAIGRSTADRTKMWVNRRSGRSAMTHYRVLRRFPEITLVELCLQTGRTHQIRVHLSYIGHPVIGDPEYRRNATPYLQRLEQKHTRIAAAIRRINRQMLHAQALSFQHPRDKRTITLTAPLPHDFASLVQLLEASFR